MRLKINHVTEYSYDEPVQFSLQRLRLTPIENPGLHVLSWTIVVDGANVEAGFNDQFGNHTHLVSFEGDAKSVRIVASGEVKTEDRAGVFGAHTGYVPLWLYLRDTPRTKAGKLVRDLVKSLAGDNELARMHDLMARVHSQVRYETGATTTETTAEQALEAGTGVCQDHAHVMISAARLMNLPARYISGYLMMDGVEQQTATHAWAEIHLPSLGWVGFDAANNVCPDARYVRLASGLSYADAAPVSGMRIGLAGEDMSVTVSVAETGQSQSQSQG
ncbi:transglutaminase family protein [Agrobacterium vitis]|uniref:Transglutaminase family protein n=1 Tax=Agrobacterium vitis TaxID=373 RepID=A0A368NS75_AGRVI|nr:transglutaminase family protein [Agrobacterium vitis]KAA3517418.1 transglutaminase family protein [Agrobacterium vitis]KAA3526818.1 transglutaminase family protein [Agrobacterium vitis]MCF1477176.1 transglutaminase family protein [Agrobacterium vitis]MUZ72931.1 transglutaminase family protein [Agrobacterium vitis]MUZ95639.1 transglutaminase family protein [Agrobacterium vitis]